MKLQSILLITLNLGAQWTAGAQTPTTGGIRGTIVDNQQTPVSGARVNVSREGQPGQSVAHYVESDAAGHFSIDGLTWGTYKLFVMKEQSGYPNMHFSFYSNDVFPTATLTPTAPIAELRIQLDAQAGSLSGSISDEASGAPLSADFKLMRAEAPQKWLSVGVAPSYRVLLPPNTAVIVQVSAPGFKTWTLPSPLLLHSGEVMHLDIGLERSHDSNLHTSRFLLPNGYRGWVLVNFNTKDAPLTPVESGIQIFKFPLSGTITTSSCGPQKGALNEFFYYANDGSLQAIPMDYRSGKGIVWGQYEGVKNGVPSQFGFFVGTEEQYTRDQKEKTHPGPIPNP